MNISKITVSILLYLSISTIQAQTVDLSSVDEFFNVTSTLKEGKPVSEQQWKDFDNSTAYKKYAERENKFLINTIKSSVNIVFGKGTKAEKDSILNISEKEMMENKKLMIKNLVLKNYLDVNRHYDSIVAFRRNYDFDELVNKAKQRLSTFLGKEIDSSIKFNPVYFFFVSADGNNQPDAIYVDFNLIYKYTEKQRVDFIAHEYFHNYREHFENHDFNYKCDLNYTLDMIPNEGIADCIDKTAGYKAYYAYIFDSPKMVETMVNLYNQAPNDLERLQNVILDYSKEKISETELIDNVIEIVKFNGHPIGFYMANTIINAGYKHEMIESFYNPYRFYKLYNKAAKKQKGFQLSNDFMDYLKDITKGYYH